MIFGHERLVGFKHPVDLFIGQFFNCAQRYPGAQVPCSHALKTQNLAGPLVDKQDPSPQQIPDRSLLFWIDIPFRQYVQSSHMRQPEGFPPVIGIFESFILFDSGWVGQMDLVAMLLKAIHQPVPVVGSFHHNAIQIAFERFQHTERTSGRSLLIRLSKTRLSVSSMMPM